MPPNL